MARASGLILMHVTMTGHSVLSARYTPTHHDIEGIEMAAKNDSTLCSADGCARTVHCKALCEPHYRRQLLGRKKAGPITQYKDSDARFDQCVDRDGNCWLWIEAKDKDGYGKFCANGRKNTRAHRYSYERYVGPIPDGLFVCHTCDTPSCVNPKHLWLGTVLDNQADMVSKGRSMQGSQHPNAILNEDSVKAIRSGRASGCTYVELAKRYGVHTSTVSNIISNRAWKHVSG